MISFTIRQGDITTTVFNNDRVFDLIYKITNDKAMTIEVTSWSELASVGDIYETGTFTVEVIDNGIIIFQAKIWQPAL
jgi:hypothetical protein